MQSRHQSGPHRSVGVHIPNSRSHLKAWESVSPAQGATAKPGSPYLQLKGPQKFCGFEICGQNLAFEMGLPENPQTPPQNPQFLPNKHPTQKKLAKRPPKSYQKKPHFFPIKNTHPKKVPKHPPPISFTEKKPHCLPKKTKRYQKTPPNLTKTKPILTENPQNLTKNPPDSYQTPPHFLPKKTPNLTGGVFWLKKNGANGQVFGINWYRLGKNGAGGFGRNWCQLGVFLVKKK